MSAVPSPNWPWPASWAPQWLDQSFNNGWTFGNVIVTTANSKAPEIEREVVSRHSYGRQIGRLTDAVVAIASHVGVGGEPQVAPLLKLAQEIEAIKERAKVRRCDELLGELRDLKKRDPAAWAQLVKAVDG